MRAVEPSPDVLDSREAGGRIIRGGAVRAAGHAINNLIALAGVVLVTRYLGVADFGRFQTVISLITVVGTVTDAGMAALGMREYAQRAGSERDRFMQSLTGLRLALTLTGAAIAAGVAAALGYEPELVLGAALAGIGLALTVVQTNLSIPLAVGLRNVALAGLDIARQTLTVAGYAVLVVLGAGVVAFLGVTVPVGIAMIVVAALLVRGQIPLRPTVRPREWAELLTASSAFVMATAVGTIYLFVAQIVTAAVTDARQTGLFSISFRIFIVVAAVAGLLVTVAFPLLSRAARDDRERLAYAIQRLLDTTVVLGAAAVICMVVGAASVIDVVAGGEFEDAAPSLRIQALTVMASFVLAPIGFALLSIHAHRGLLLANVVAFAVTMPAVALLASAFGAEGAAIGSVAGEWTLAAGYFVALRRAAPTLVPDLWPLAKVAAAAAPAVALALVPGVAAWILAGLALLVYIALAAVLRAIPEELLEQLPRLRRRR
jgi:O-antigen/teichoic acid export membrane protein